MIISTIKSTLNHIGDIKDTREKVDIAILNKEILKIVEKNKQFDGRNQKDC